MHRGAHLRQIIEAHLIQAMAKDKAKRLTAAQAEQQQATGAPTAVPAASTSTKAKQSADDALFSLIEGIKCNHSCGRLWPCRQRRAREGAVLKGPSWPNRRRGTTHGGAGEGRGREREGARLCPLGLSHPLTLPFGSTQAGRPLWHAPSSGLALI
jgi:hypothetical protein